MRLANDANCFALSEATDGAAAGAAVVFGVIIGTGTGGGLVVNGRVVAGANAIAGEWGHNPLPAPEDDERPGPAVLLRPIGLHRNVPVGPALARDYIALGGDDLSAVEIAARAERGDARARGCLERYERRFARAIAAMINVIDPDVIVLGGGLSNIAAALRARPGAVGGRMSFPITSTRGWSARSTATPAASAAQRGCGSRAAECLSAYRCVRDRVRESHLRYNRAMKLRIFLLCSGGWLAVRLAQRRARGAGGRAGAGKTVWDGVFTPNRPSAARRPTRQRAPSATAAIWR